MKLLVGLIAMSVSDREIRAAHCGSNTAIAEMQKCKWVKISDMVGGIDFESFDDRVLL